MDNFMDGGDVPMGLAMALAQNLGAMNYFAALTPEERRSVIDRTHAINSKEEMQSFVDALPKSK